MHLYVGLLLKSNGWAIGNSQCWKIRWFVIVVVKLFITNHRVLGLLSQGVPWDVAPQGRVWELSYSLSCCVSRLIVHGLWRRRYNALRIFRFLWFHSQKLTSIPLFYRTAWLAYILVGPHGARLRFCWSHCLVDDRLGWWSSLRSVRRRRWLPSRAWSRSRFVRRSHISVAANLCGLYLYRGCCTLAF